MNSTSKLAVVLFVLLCIVIIITWPREVEKRNIPYNHYPIGTGVIGGK